MMFRQEENVTMSLRSLQIQVLFVCHLHAVGLRNLLLMFHEPQGDCLTRLVALVDTIRSEYDELAESVWSSVVMMPLENATLPDPGGGRLCSYLVCGVRYGN